MRTRNSSGTSKLDRRPGADFDTLPLMPKRNAPPDRDGAIFWWKPPREGTTKLSLHMPQLFGEPVGHLSPAGRRSVGLGFAFEANLLQM